MPLTLTTIVCTKDRPEALKACLRSLLEQVRLPDELVIVDDGVLAEEKLQESLQEFRGIFRYLQKNQPGLAASRNAGVKAARGDLISFLDDDVTLDRNYYQNVVTCFEQDSAHKIGGITGCLDIPANSLIQIYLKIFLLDSSRPGKILSNGSASLVRKNQISTPLRVDWLSGSNMTYRSEIFNTFSFDENYPGYGWGEDKDFSFRVSKKYHLQALPNALATHHKIAASRIGQRKFGWMEIFNYIQFFNTYMPKKLNNYLALIWSVWGILLKNFSMALISDNHLGYFRQLSGNFQALVDVVSRRDNQIQLDRLVR